MPTAFCKKCEKETRRNARGRCLDCLAANQRRYYAKTLAHPRAPIEERRAHRREYMRKYRADNRDRARATWRREQRLKRYGLTEADFLALHAKQEGRCAVCREPLDPADKRTHIDHDHRSGKVRGLLCHRCNVQLPQTAALARSALAYLEQHECVA